MQNRIERFLKENNISSAKLADSINVNRASVSHILSGRNKPSFDFISKFLKHYKDVDANWLLTGNGEMFKDINRNFTGKLNFENSEKKTKENTHTIEEEKIEDKIPDIKEFSKVKKVLIFYSDNRIEEFNSGD